MESVLQMMSDVGIRGRLQQISEELADLAIERLRESIDAGGAELPVEMSAKPV